MADETTTAATTETATTTATETAHDWRAGIPEDLRADPSLATFKDVGGLAKSYVETKKMVGQNGTRRPADDAPDEEWAAYFGKREGRPESVEKYGFKVPTLPEGMAGINEEDVSEFRALSHSLGLGDRETQAFANWEAKRAIRAHDRLVEHDAARKKAAIAELRQEWGPAMERNVGLARQVIKDKADNDPVLAQAVEDYGNHVPLLKLLAWMGESMMEHGEITAQVPGGETLEDLQAKMDKMREDPDPQNWPKAKRDEWESLVIRADRLQQRRRT